MNNYSIVNLNQFTWHLNVALLGGAFAVFSLIYNEYYIYYGLITFAFGVFGHMVFKFWEWLFRKKDEENKIDTNNKYYWLVFASNAVLSTLWIGAVLYIY